MADERGYYEVNAAAPRRVSNPEGPILFKGRGDALLTVYGYETWKEFLYRGDRPLTDAELDRIEEAATSEHYAIGGRIAVEWPDVEIKFAMDPFLGRKKKNPFIVTVKQNFSTIMHPFSVNSEWCRYLGDKDNIKLNGYEWVFEQEKENFSEYKGHIRNGKEIFITFEFTADWRYHYTRRTHK